MKRHILVLFKRQDLLINVVIVVTFYLRNSICTISVNNFTFRSSKSGNGRTISTYKELMVKWFSKIVNTITFFQMKPYVELLTYKQMKVVFYYYTCILYVRIYIKFDMRSTNHKNESIAMNMKIWNQGIQMTPAV